MTMKSDAKFEEKLTCDLENDMRKMANFHQSNPDPDKQVSETLFSKKKKREKRNYPPLTLNGDNVKTTISQKHLGLVLDSKLNFNEHIIRLINAIK